MYTVYIFLLLGALTVARQLRKHLCGLENHGEIGGDHPHVLRWHGLIFGIIERLFYSNDVVKTINHPFGNGL